MLAKPQSLVDHLELYFGRIESGWESKEWADPAIQVVSFCGGMIHGINTLGTLGLSSFALQSPVSDKQIRQELFIMIKDSQVDPTLAAILDQIAREHARSNTPVLRGDMIIKENSLFNVRDFVGFFVTLPVYYPDSFWTFRDEQSGDVVFGWLFPIKRKEQLYVSQNGWSAFEQVLDKAQFDLFDLDRPCLV